MPLVCTWVPPGLIGMPLCALVSSRVICLLIWLWIFILLYCSVCVSICVVHYFIVFLIIFIHSTTCQHLSPHLICTVRLFCTAIHWWRCLNSHKNIWITVKRGLVRTKRSWLIYLATQDKHPLECCLLGLTPRPASILLQQVVQGCCNGG